MFMNPKISHFGSSEGWHPERIKAAIRMRGITCEALSTQNGLHKSAVGRALLGPWPRVERIVAAFLGLAPQDIWPDRYDPSGQPLKGRTEHKNRSSDRKSAQRQKRKAA